MGDQEILSAGICAGLYTIRLIHDRMGLLLPDSEAGFIALHFVNAQYSTHMKDTLSLPHLMRDIMDIVMSELNVNLMKIPFTTKDL